MTKRKSKMIIIIMMIGILSNLLVAPIIEGNIGPQPIPIYKEKISGELIFVPNETKELLLFDLFETSFTKNDSKLLFALNCNSFFTINNITNIYSFDLEVRTHNGTHVMEYQWYYRTNGNTDIVIRTYFKCEYYNQTIILTNTSPSLYPVSVFYYGSIIEGYYSPPEYYSSYNWWFDNIIGMITLIILICLGSVVFFFGFYKLISFVIEKFDRHVYRPLLQKKEEKE